MTPVFGLYLQEMGQHHVHVHVLLLPPAAHEAQVLPAGDGPRLQRLLLGLQQGFHRESKLRRILEHLPKEMSHVFITHRLYYRNMSSISHKVRIQVKGCGQVPGVVLLCGPTVHHEETHPVLKCERLALLGPFSLSRGKRLMISWWVQAESVADLLQLVGLQDLRDGHGETQSLTQVSVFFLQGHQAATKQVLVHLMGQGEEGQKGKVSLRYVFHVSIKDPCSPCALPF